MEISALILEISEASTILYWGYTSYEVPNLFILAVFQLNILRRGIDG